MSPFIIGVNTLSENQWSHLSPEEFIANGKKQAQQRAYERDLRDSKFKLRVTKELGDETLIEKYQTRVGSLNRGLNTLLAENDFLHRDTAREQVERHRVLSTARVTNSRESSIIEVVTSDGVVVSSASDHFQDQAAGRGISEHHVRDALENPLHIADNTIDAKGRPARKYIGYDATVVINPLTGNRVTTYLTGERRRRKYES
jgi:hypothetical protein